jgi:hypothetical protein
MRLPIALFAVALAFAVQAKAQTVQTLQAEIVLLKAAITAQGVIIAALQKQGAATQTTDTAQSANVAALQRQLTLIASNPALQLGPFVSVDPNPENGVAGPNIVFKGANIHVINGANPADAINGLGNLIIGNDAAPTNLQPGDRGGSHNLVVGDLNLFNSRALDSVVFGSGNAIQAQYSSILGGVSNIAKAPSSVVVGGENNGVVGFGPAVVVGGNRNGTFDSYDVILGGFGNDTDGPGSIVVSGTSNSAEQKGVVVLGGNSIKDFVGSTIPGGVLSGPITIVTPTPTPVPAAAPAVGST